MPKAALKPAPPPPAKEAEAQAAPAKPAKARKKPRGKLLWIVIFLLILAAGAVSWVFLGETPGAADAPAQAQAQPETPPTFVNLDVFTVNLQPEVGDQYLQVTLSVKATDPSVDAAMKLHMPDIRNRLLLLLSSKKPSELQSTPGKVQLSAEILEEIKKPLPEPVRQHVAAVYFTSFVIQ